MKKILAMVLVCIMALTLCSFASADERELLVIDVYDDAANNHGTQTGWFGKVVKDRFNIELNIIAPQVVGESVYATRTSEGNLGDLIIMDKTKFLDVLDAGLVRDISDKIYGCENLMNYKLQIETYNKNLDMGDVIYAIPAEMTDTSPVTLTGELIGSQPQLRWDLYTQIGRPQLKDLDDLLAALKAIREVHPVNENGDPAYPISLWPDWDNNDNMSGPANVVQLTTWYGEKVKGSAILRPDYTFTTIYDRDAAYYKIAKFLFKANQMGIVDPESGEQDWNAVCAKISNGRADMIWYGWEIGFWNSQDRLDNGTAFQFIPVNDMYFYADADYFYGSSRVWAIGAGVEGEKYDRLMEFLDWYASPESLVFQHDGIEGLNYTLDENGKFVPYMDNALMDNLPVPEEYGGGGYQDGFNAINQWICGSICTNPSTGETYDMKYWASYKAKNMTQMKAEWQETFGAEDAVDWMKKNDKLLASPNVSANLKTDDSDIAMMRSEVNKSLCKYTWQAFFAKDEAEFEAIWDTMIEELNGYGYEDLYAYDCENWQVEVDAKIAAAEATK